MDVDLQNRIARKALETLLAYAREFGESDTLFEPDTLGLTAAEFSIVLARLVATGLAEAAEDENCSATPQGLAVAASRAELDDLFPVTGNPDDPLPSELAIFGSRAFTRVCDAPPPIAWNEYQRHLSLVWPRLLNSEQQHNEGAFQGFLEKHPALLPDCYDCFRRGASPMRSAYYTQPELPGFRAKKPDFMTIMYDSDAVIVLLIEIEAPAKRWTTKAGTPSAELTQALDQLRDWKAWFQEPENVLQFQKLYHLDQRLLEKRQFTQRYVLVYGRRDEASANPIFAKKRALLAHSDQVLMTYDRLQPTERMRRSPTVRLDRANRDGQLAAVHVPPTLQIGPHNAEELTRMTGLRDAIAANELISEKRKRFLIERINYWEEWSRQPLVIDPSMSGTSDFYLE